MKERNLDSILDLIDNCEGTQPGHCNGGRVLGTGTGIQVPGYCLSTWFKFGICEFVDHSVFAQLARRSRFPDQENRGVSGAVIPGVT